MRSREKLVQPGLALALHQLLLLEVFKLSHNGSEWDVLASVCEDMPLLYTSWHSSRIPEKKGFSLAAALKMQDGFFQCFVFIWELGHFLSQGFYCLWELLEFFVEDFHKIESNVEAPEFLIFSSLPSVFVLRHSRIRKFIVIFFLFKALNVASHGVAWHTILTILFVSCFFFLLVYMHCTTTTI